MMHLFNSYCKPILLYGVESVCLSRKNLSTFSHRWRAIFWKLFGVSDVSYINDILHSMGYQPLATKIDARRTVFLRRLQSTSNSLMHFLYDALGSDELLSKGFSL